MTKRNEVELYNLSLEAGSSCFQSFLPEIYTEVRGYQNNAAFDNQKTHSLLSLANKALVFFTRSESPYETDLKIRYSYISKKNKKKSNYNVSGFSADHFRAFNKPRSDFEEAVTFCLKILCSRLDEDEFKTPKDERSGYNDSVLLDSCFRDEFLKSNIKFKTSRGCTYFRSHLLGAFSLWKLDRALAAIAQNKASDVANLIVDIHAALNISQREFNSELIALTKKKEKSESQAKKGGKSPKKLEPAKAEAVKIYKKGNNGKKWRSVKQAAEIIEKELRKKNLGSSLSEEEGVTTISGWLTKADPKGELSGFKRKKSPG